MPIPSIADQRNRGVAPRWNSIPDEGISGVLDNLVSAHRDLSLKHREMGEQYAQLSDKLAIAIARGL